MDLIWRLRIGMVIGAIAALVYGSFNLYTSLTNMSPTTLKYTEYCQQRPDAKWLELSESWVDFRDAVEIQTVEKKKSSDKNGRVIKSEYFAPIYQAHDSEEVVVAFLKCNDSNSLSLAREGSTANISDEDQLVKWYVANDKRMFLNRTVKGLVIFGLSADSEDRKLLNQAAGGRLDSNFIIIDENAEPKGGLGFLLVILGLALLGGAGATFMMKKKQPQVPMLPHRSPPNSPHSPGAFQPLGARPGGNRAANAPMSAANQSQPSALPPPKQGPVSGPSRPGQAAQKPPAASPPSQPQAPRLPKKRPPL